ncbi:hypothetical protein DMENIID0001_112470 [Sergentomyia squamirostris]
MTWIPYCQSPSPPIHTQAVDNLIIVDNNLDDNANDSNDIKPSRNIVKDADTSHSPLALSPTHETPPAQSDSQLLPFEVLKEYMFYPEELSEKKKKKKSHSVLTSPEVIAIAPERINRKRKGMT